MKNGLPAGARVDVVGQSVRARVIAEEVGEQRADGVGAERRQRDLTVVRLLHPVGAVLGTEVHDEEARRLRDRVHPLGEEGLARRVEPVQVLDQREHALGADPRVLDDLPKRREDLALLAPRDPSRGTGRSGSGTRKNSNMTGRTSRSPSSSSRRRPAILSRAVASSSRSSIP